MTDKEKLDKRIAELESTYAQLLETINTSTGDRHDAAIRMRNGCGTELAKVKARRKALGN